MAETTPAESPTGLGRRGRAFWRSTVASFDLSEVELELLRECCRLLYECEVPCGALEAGGTTVKGSTGQPRVHPALGELRQHRLALGKLLAQLALPDYGGARLPSPPGACSACGSDPLGDSWLDVRP